MKLLYGITAALVVLAAGLFGFSYFLPKQAVVKQTMLVNASPNQVFPFINNTTNWKRWCAWNKNYDSSLIYMYGGPVSGVGARQNWNGDKTGNWHMVFTVSAVNDSLTYELRQDGQPAKSNGSFTLEKTEKGTLVTWQQTTPLEDNLLDLYKGAYQNYKTEKQIQEGLANLQALILDTKNNTAKK